MQWRAWGDRNTKYFIGPFETYRAIRVDAEYRVLVWVQPLLTAFLKPPSGSNGHPWLPMKGMFLNYTTSHAEEVQLILSLSLHRKDFNEALVVSFVSCFIL